MIEQFEIVAKAIADSNRLRILKALEWGELCVCQVTALLGLAPATVSKHLAILRTAGMISARKDGRWVYYTLGRRALNPYAPILQTLLVGAMNDDRVIAADRNRLEQIKGIPLDVLCGSREPVEIEEPGMEEGAIPMSDKTYNVLFLCTGNSARSILAEALLTHLGAGRFNAFSAGSHPTGTVNHVALETLRIAGMPLADPRSKSWDEFAVPGAPMMDFVFTVCDSAAGEICPVWPGQPLTAHWGVPDPAAFKGSAAETRAEFSQVFRMLRHRIDVFANLRMEALDRIAIKNRIDEIGRLPVN